MRDRLRAWYNEELSGMEEFLNTEERPDATRVERKSAVRRWQEQLLANPEMQREIQIRQKRYHTVYRVIAVLSCILFIAIMLYMIAHFPRFGFENPRADVIARRYLDEGLKETGAVNIVAAMILDYRAFDTLGESHVLFTALVCVLILLRIDRKNQLSGKEDYYTIRNDTYFDLSKDPILRTMCRGLLPCILLYGVYILLNGQNSPGGGFSGGAVIGAGMILFSAAFGMKAADRFLTMKLCLVLTVVSLFFYSFAKGYVFFMGANGLETHIPKGIPGAILSGGMILPLDIAVGCVVGCTMFGFYSLFRRGNIGGRI